MDLKKLETEIETYRTQVRFSESLEKLYENRDFQEVILNGYLKEHVLSLVKQRNTSKEPDDKISRSIDAVSYLMAYLDEVLTIGATARDHLTESEQTLEDHYKEV